MAQCKGNCRPSYGSTTWPDTTNPACGRPNWWNGWRTNSFLRISARDRQAGAGTFSVPLWSWQDFIGRVRFSLGRQVSRLATGEAGLPAAAQGPVDLKQTQPDFS